MLYFFLSFQFPTIEIDDGGTTLTNYHWYMHKIAKSICISFSEFMCLRCAIWTQNLLKEAGAELCQAQFKVRLAIQATEPAS